MTELVLAYIRDFVDRLLDDPRPRFENALLALFLLAVVLMVTVMPLVCGGS